MAINPVRGPVVDDEAALSRPFVIANAAPTNGTSGTHAGYAPNGALLIRTDSTTPANAKLYINTGTKASPTWVAVGSQT